MGNKRTKTILYRFCPVNLAEQESSLEKGTNKITNWFPTATKRSISSDTDESLDEVDELPYDEVVNSGNDDSEFTLNSLDTILKEKPDDVRLRVVSQFLHLITNGGFSKLAASELLASSVNKGPWHARVIRSWANQWLSNGQLS